MVKVLDLSKEEVTKAIRDEKVTVCVVGLGHVGLPLAVLFASRITKLIDGPSEKSQIMPSIKSEIALDTPAPYLDAEKRRLFLYYSVADRANEVWKIALTTFNLDSELSM